MSTFLYFAIEGRPQGHNGRWRFMQRMEDPGTTSDVHGLLGLEDDSSTSGNRLELRGLPDDVDDETLAEDAFFVDDALAESHAGDCVNARFCSSNEAKDWAASGRARLLTADRVTSPEAFGHSWANACDLERVLHFADRESGVVAALRETLEIMRYLQEANIDVRAIYWFE